MSLIAHTHTHTHFKEHAPVLIILTLDNKKCNDEGSRAGRRARGGVGRVSAPLIHKTHYLLPVQLRSSLLKLQKPQHMAHFNMKVAQMHISSYHPTCVSALALGNVEVKRLCTNHEGIRRSEDDINLGARWMSAASFAPRPSYPRGRTPVRIEREGVGSRCGLDVLEKSKISCPCSGISKPDLPARTSGKRYELTLKS